MPIPVMCPSCSSKLRAPEKMAGRQTTCPKCGRMVDVPDRATEVHEPPDSQRRLQPPRGEVDEQRPSHRPALSKTVIWLAVVCFVFLFWSIVSTIHASSLASELVQIKSNIARLTQEAEDKLAEARRESEKINDLALRDQEKLQEVFGTLQKYRPGSNVGKQYLDRFEVTGHTIKAHLVNRTKESIKPHVVIRFLNRYGFITDVVRIQWFVDRIGSDETRIEENFVSFLHGDPVYYTVTFDEREGEGRRAD